jgi:hypothetical protein
MTPRRYFHQTYQSPYFQSEEYKATPGYRFEQKCEGIFNKIVCIPRRFLRGIKKAIWPL